MARALQRRGKTPGPVRYTGAVKVIDIFGDHATILGSVNAG